ncbi:FABP family protein [Aestuariimicrobium ganziense]|uniref:FABP family protein n=1 Tax=Aestuariimicrobium ganziense TaxID=2773677 RepID=UPI0019456460|nr:FABP family protein [Aestuariimicrobium ganziense]
MTHVWQDWAGTWRGRGDGEYPTIDDFAWTEELVIAPVPGRPLALWTSRTRDEVSGDPRHSETGYLRRTPSGVQLVLAHAFGATEIAEGSGDEHRIDLVAGPLPSVPGGKPIDGVERHYEREGDQIRYTLAMAAVGVEMSHHLGAVLRRLANPEDGTL